MLRDLNLSSDGRRDSTDPRVGKLASEIPTGGDKQAFLLNDIDPAYPNRLYSVNILTLPSSGVLYLDKAGVGSFTGAPDGTYTGTQRVQKFDPGVGRVSSADTTYSLSVGAAPSTVTGVTISPSTASGSQAFVATVAGANSPSQAVTWSKTGGGAITAGGVFTAPAPTTSAQVITITATSVQDGNFAGLATVTIAAVAPQPIVTGVTVTPALAALIGSATQQFSATVQGSNGPSQAVTWSTTVGDIDASGVLTAPSATLLAQIGTVTATSVAKPEESGSATVTVLALLGGGDVDPVLRKVQLQLGEAHGPAANLSGIRVSFAAGNGPHDAGPYLFQSANETTSSNGLLEFTMPDEAIAAGASGVLSVLLPDGRHYLGVVAVL